MKTKQELDNLSYIALIKYRQTLLTDLTNVESKWERTYVEKLFSLKKLQRYAYYVMLKNGFKIKDLRKIVGFQDDESTKESLGVGSWSYGKFTITLDDNRVLVFNGKTEKLLGSSDNLKSIQRKRK